MTNQLLGCLLSADTRKEAANGLRTNVTRKHLLSDGWRTNVTRKHLLSDGWRTNVTRKLLLSGVAAKPPMVFMTQKIQCIHNWTKSAINCKARTAPLTLSPAPAGPPLDAHGSVNTCVHRINKVITCIN